MGARLDSPHARPALIDTLSGRRAGAAVPDGGSHPSPRGQRPLALVTTEIEESQRALDATLERLRRRRRALTRAFEELSAYIGKLGEDDEWTWVHEVAAYLQGEVFHRRAELVGEMSDAIQAYSRLVLRLCRMGGGR